MPREDTRPTIVTHLRDYDAPQKYLWKRPGPWKGIEPNRMSIVEKFISMDYGSAPEDPREALLWLDQHSRRLGHFINGAWQLPAAGLYFDTTDPSTGETLAEVAQGSAADIHVAVKAARAALPAWQSLTPHERARYPMRGG